MNSKTKAWLKKKVRQKHKAPCIKPVCAAQGRLSRPVGKVVRSPFPFMGRWYDIQALFISTFHYPYPYLFYKTLFIYNTNSVNSAYSENLSSI